MRTSLNRVRVLGRDPLLKTDLDEAPRKYAYCEAKHGPSRRTTAIRRITRRKLAGIVAWAEPEEVHVYQGNKDDDSGQGCPTAEEEARLYLEQEEYYATLDENPFSLGGADTFEEDDAAEFWSEIPAAALGTGPAEPDEQPADDDPQPQTDNDLARELFGVDLDAARTSRRKATANAQGLKFWQNLEDCSAPTGRGTRDLPSKPVDDLFEDSDDAQPATGTNSPPSERSGLEPAEPTAETIGEPGLSSTLSEPLRAGIKRRKDGAIAKKQRKLLAPTGTASGASSSGSPPQTTEAHPRGNKRPAVTDAQRLQIATNRQAAASKKLRIATARAGTARPSWSIVKATSKLFGTSDSASSNGCGLTPSQRARIACSIAAATSNAGAADNAQEAAGGLSRSSTQGATTPAEATPTAEVAAAAIGTATAQDDTPAPTGDEREQSPSEPAEPAPAAKQDAAAEVVTKDPGENLGLRLGFPARRRNSQGAHSQVVSLQHSQRGQDGVRTPSCPPDRIRSPSSAGGDLDPEREAEPIADDLSSNSSTSSSSSSSDTEEVVRDPHENPGLRLGDPASRRNSQGTAEQVVSPHRSSGGQEGALAPLCPQDQILPSVPAGGYRARGTDESSSRKKLKLNTSDDGETRDATALNLDQESIDDSEPEDAEPEAELSIEPEWETSFASFLLAKRRRTQEEPEPQANPATAHAEPSNAEPFSDLQSDELSDLLDLASDGIPVSWPKGLDERIVKLILAKRRRDG